MINSMIKKRWIMLIILVILFGTAVFLAESRNDYGENQRRAGDILENKFAQMVETPNDRLRLKDFDSFTWDTVYIFPPYTPIQDVNSKLGFYWTDNKYLAQDDNEHLVVFVFKKQVVQYFVTRRASFEDNVYFKALHPDNATFKWANNKLTLAGQ